MVKFNNQNWGFNLLSENEVIGQDHGARSQKSRLLSGGSRSLRLKVQSKVKVSQKGCLRSPDLDLEVNVIGKFHSRQGKNVQWSFLHHRLAQVH